MKLSAPAAERNREPIAEVLAQCLPDSGLVLEIASGSGTHLALFADKFDQLQWQPSDMQEERLASIRAQIRETELTNAKEPLFLDVTKSPWPLEAADFILCINMIHASERESCPALLMNAAQLLDSGKRLFLYGPFKFKDRETAASNLAFDEDLKSRNPSWGLWYLEEVVSLAHELGFDLHALEAMPANNHSVVFQKR